MARKSPPTGSEIAEKARQHKFDPDKTVEATRAKDKVHVRFAQTLHETPIPKEEAENGVVLGRVDADLGESHSKLRPGKYHLFMAKVGDSWKGYAELNGEIAIEAKRIEVDEGKEARDVSGVKPTVKFGSICFTACIIVLIPIGPILVPVPYCWTWCI